MPSATFDDIRRADRILLHGVTGSGKSTAALRLGSVLGLPVHLVDEEIGWLPGWVERPEAEMRRLAAAVVAEPRWVMDSAYGSFRDLVMARADVIVALDHPRWLSLGRLTRRTIHRLRTKDLICNGNTESLRQLLSRDSIVLWHFRSFGRKRQAMRAWRASDDGVPVLLLRHPRELEELIRALDDSTRSPHLAVALREAAVRFGGLDDVQTPLRNDVARVASLEEFPG